MQHRGSNEVPESANNQNGVDKSKLAKIIQILALWQVTIYLQPIMKPSLLMSKREERWEHQTKSLSCSQRQMAKIITQLSFNYLKNMTDVSRSTDMFLQLPNG